jgi:hypothetical protein
MPDIWWQYGAEDRVPDGSMWDSGGGGGGTINPVRNPASGDYGMKWVLGSGQTRYLGKFLTGNSDFVFSGKLYIDTLPGTVEREVLRQFWASQTKVALFTINPSGTLTAKFGATGSPATSASASNLSVGQYYLIETRVRIGIATATMEWRIDGVDQTQPTTQTGNTTLNDLRVGAADLGASTAGYTWDDMAISLNQADYPLGAMSVFDGMNIQTERSLSPALSFGAF